MSVTDKPKTPEFNLRKKPEPEPLPDPAFRVVIEGDTWSIKMNGYTVIGGLSEKAAIDLQHQIYLAVVEPRWSSSAINSMRLTPLRGGDED